jgi:phage head maturation protease
MSKQFNLSIPISKIDEDQRMVWGIATSEAVDSQGDVVDYEASKAAFSAWLGNIREMHQPVAVGKAIDIQFDDVNKQVMIGAKISESTDGENAWIKVKENVLTGFSIGGSVKKVAKEVAKDKNGNDTPVTRIMEYELSETSLVDSPANPEAMFIMVKSQKGGLQRVEHEASKAEIHKGFRLPAWHLQFMPTMEKAQALYNTDMKKAGIAVVDSDPRDADGNSVSEVTVAAPVKAGTKVTKPVYSRNGTFSNKAKGNDNMSQKIEKGMWDAAWLLDLAIELGYYINNEQYEGEDVSALTAALDTIKAAVVQELNETTPELTTAVELAQKVSNLAKASKEDDMTKGNVVGGVERDEEAKVVEDLTPKATEADAEVVAEVATEGEAEEAAEVVADETVEAVEPAADEKAAPAKVDVVDAAAKEAVVEEATTEETDKAVTTGDLKKFTDGLINKIQDINKSELSKVLGAFSDKVEKSMASLEGRIKNIEDQPAAPTFKSSFVEVEKGKEGQALSEDVDVQTLLKRQDELVANPSLGTPKERMELAQQLRKAQANGATLQTVSN